MSYPQTPGFKDNETSKESAETFNKSEIIKARVMVALNKHGPLSADQCAAWICEDRGNVRPRMSELLAEERIYVTGKRVKNKSGKSAKCYATLENESSSATRPTKSHE